MSFDSASQRASKHIVQRELEGIQCALRAPLSDDRYCQLYAAQQALSWVQEPWGFATPYDVIMGGKVQPLIGDIQEGSTDCLVPRHPAPS